MTPNLVTNADCVQSAVLTGSDWSGDTRFSFNGSGTFATLYALDGPGNYVMSVAYVASSGPVRVHFRDAGYFTLPEAADGNIAVIHATVTDPEAFGAIQFDDLGDAAGYPVHVDLRKVS